MAVVTKRSLNSSSVSSPSASPAIIRNNALKPSGAGEVMSMIIPQARPVIKPVTSLLNAATHTVSAISGSG